MVELSPKQQDALKLLEDGQEYQNYFFLKATDLIWFHPLKEKGYFSATNNPRPIKDNKGRYIVPYWSALEYLDKISKECSKPENLAYAEELMKILRDVTKPKDGKTSDNYRTWWIFAKILANLPTEVIQLDDTDLIKTWIESAFDNDLPVVELSKGLLPKLFKSENSNDQQKAIKIIDLVTQVKFVERKYLTTKQEAKTIIEPFILQELFKINTPFITEKCAQNIIELLIKKIEEAVSLDDDRFCYIWRPAVEKDPQNVEQDTPRAIFIDAIRDIFLPFAEKNKGEAEVLLKRYFQSKLSIIKRMALYFIAMHYDKFSNIFWQNVNMELFDITMRHELFTLIKRNFSKFSTDEQDRIISIISALTYDWLEGEEKRKAEARLRLEWLEAIKDQGSVKADRIYEECLSSEKIKPEHPEFPSYTKSGWGYESPYKIEDILSIKDTPELVKKLNDFESKGGVWEPSEEGLGESVRAAVKQDSMRFANNLPAFKNAKPTYQYNVLRAYEDLWRDKQDIPWDKILDFGLALVISETIWQKAGNREERRLLATNDWVISEICELISEGTRNDERAFDEKYLPQAEKILSVIFQNQESTAKGRENDAFTEAINTTKGKAIIALIHYSLRQARLLKKRSESHQTFWQSIEPIYNAELDKCKDNNFEFSAIAGSYLPNLHFLSKEWVENRIDDIFSTTYERNWLCAIQGYAYVQTVYMDIYNLLRNHGHLERALSNVKDKQTREKIIQNIAIAYLRNQEELKGGGSLFTKILEKWEQEDIRDIVSFFSMHQEIELKEDMKQRILEFWKYCIEKINGREEEYALLLSDLNLLAVFLKKIEEEQKNWLLKSAAYVNENHHSSFFIKHLDKLVNNSPEEVAVVYLKMLEGTIPTYPQENIRPIVEKLYKAGHGSFANDICDKYARNGYPALLKDIYDQYNN